MPRRSAGAVRRARTPPASDPRVRLGGGQEQDTREGTFLVRPTAGAAALKTYRCPGCDHEVRAGVAHVVVWPTGSDGTDRRHWHSSCWHRRATRGGPGPLPWTAR